MATIYSRLGLNFTPSNSSIITLSSEAKAHLNSMPRFMQDWQIADIANTNVGGYFKNPVANASASLVVNTSIIFAIANNDPANTWINSAEALILSNTANNFLIELPKFQSHTANISGVNNVNNAGEAVNDFPYYETATGIGKFLIYITHESDGILNSSPIIGSMTSLFINDELQANSIIIKNDLNTINTAIAGNGICTLSSASINLIISHIETANTLMVTRKDHDINFYRNSKLVLADYSEVNKFSNMGETNTKLAKEVVGTDKLITRLNS